MVSSRKKTDLENVITYLKSNDTKRDRASERAHELYTKCLLDKEAEIANLKTEIANLRRQNTNLQSSAAQHPTYVPLKWKNAAAAIAAVIALSLAVRHDVCAPLRGFPSAFIIGLFAAVLFDGQMASFEMKKTKKHPFNIKAWGSFAVCIIVTIAYYWLAPNPSPGTSSTSSKPTTGLFRKLINL